MKAGRLFAKGSMDPLIWVAAIVASAPPDALATWRHWELVDPRYLSVSVAWWPVDTLMGLLVLARLLALAQPSVSLRKPWKALASSLQAEALLSVRSTIVALLGLIPCLAFLALAGVESMWLRIVGLILAVLGLVPALLYYMRRCLAPVILLQKPLRGGEALAWSHHQLATRLGAFLQLALPWWAMSLALDGGSLVLGLSDGWGPLALTWLLGGPA